MLWVASARLANRLPIGWPSQGIEYGAYARPWKYLPNFGYKNDTLQAVNTVTQNGRSRDGHPQGVITTYLTGLYGVGYPRG
jgi:hypothetical protein